MTASSARTYRIAAAAGSAILLLIALSAIMSGCKSAPQRISERAVAIRETASSSKDRFQEAGIRVGVAEQEEIIELANGISVDATQVDPTQPWCASYDYGCDLKNGHDLLLRDLDGDGHLDLVLMDKVDAT